MKMLKLILFLLTFLLVSCGKSNGNAISATGSSSFSQYQGQSPVSEVDASCNGNSCI